MGERQYIAGPEDDTSQSDSRTEGERYQQRVLALKCRQNGERMCNKRPTLVSGMMMMMSRREKSKKRKNNSRISSNRITDESVRTHCTPQQQQQQRQLQSSIASLVSEQE